MTLPRKHDFDIPDGVIYLDGNSLGPPLKGAADLAKQVIDDEWGDQLIKAWNTKNWISLPQRIGDRLADLLGGDKGTITTGDTLSIKVYQALAAGLQMRPDRRVVLSDNGNFPSDLYMAQGLIDTIGAGHVLRTPDPTDVIKAIDEDVAVVMLTQVDYRTGRMHDMEEITQRAHEVGAVMIWDLAHSAGAVPIDLSRSGPEFAIGCTYKFLNGGPGSPAFIYVRPDIVDDVQPALAGWLGHDAPFAMEPTYRPAMATERMRVGTPPIIQASLLSHALNVWDHVDMDDVREASIALSELFISEVEARCPDLVLASPRDPEIRGSHVSFEFEQGYAALQAMIAHGVIGDFRRPNIIRFGIAPLYLDRQDILMAVDVIENVMRDQMWKDPKYQVVAAVT